LLGCEVYDEIHGSLGFLKDVIQNSAHDVYLVRKSGQADILIPVLKTVVKEVDIDNRRIEVVLPDGLFEIYRQGEE
jgi:16S rRNA processing protein RimM